MTKENFNEIKEVPCEVEVSLTANWKDGEKLERSFSGDGILGVVIEGDNAQHIIMGLTNKHLIHAVSNLVDMALEHLDVLETALFGHMINDLFLTKAKNLREERGVGVHS